MTKHTDKTKAKSTDTLVKSTRKGSIELSEQDLDKIVGGRKAGKGQQE